MYLKGFIAVYSFYKMNNMIKLGKPLLWLLLIATCVSADYFNDIERHLKAEKKSGKIASYKSFLKKMTEQNFTFSRFMGSGTYGIVLEGTNGEQPPQKVAVKIMEEKGKECKRLEDLHMMLAKGNPTMIKLYKTIQVKIVSRYHEIHFCALVMEAGIQNLNQPMFSLESRKVENSKVLEKIFFEILNGFDRLNFVDGYFHGDIKDANLVLVGGENGTLIAKIIDLDHCFSYHNPLDMHGIPGRVPWMTYTDDYRPPELAYFYPGGDFDDFSERMYHRYYKYDPEFKEDAYAMGVTFVNILKINKKYIDDNSGFFFSFRKRVLKGLLEEDIEKRLTVREAAQRTKELLGIDFRMKRSEILDRARKVLNMKSDPRSELASKKSVVTEEKRKWHLSNGSLVGSPLLYFDTSNPEWENQEVSHLYDERLKTEKSLPDPRKEHPHGQSKKYLDIQGLSVFSPRLERHETSGLNVKGFGSPKLKLGGVNKKLIR
jgi:serine/threonine protein kinase